MFSACVHSTPLQGTPAAVLPQLQIKTNTKIGYKEMGNIVDIYNLYLIVGRGGGYASGSFLPVYKRSCIIFDEHWTQYADCEDERTTQAQNTNPPTNWANKIP